MKLHAHFLVKMVQEGACKGLTAARGLQLASTTCFLYPAPVSKKREPAVALSFKDEETDRLARACQTDRGKTLTEAVRGAPAERLERERLRRGEAKILADRFLAIDRHCAELADLDNRTPEEIVGDDETGMWR